MKYRLRRSDGVYRWIEGRAGPMRNPDGNIIQWYGLGLDIEDEKQGMGMGLSICRSIIESHDRRLWATANEPRGTTFVFTLPVHARDAA